MAINFLTLAKAAFKKIDNTETYELVKNNLLNLAKNKVPNKVLALYTGFIKVYEVLKLSCKKLALKVKDSDNTLDNYCLKQGLQTVKLIAKKAIEDSDAMAKLAGIELE